MGMWYAEAQHSHIKMQDVSWVRFFVGYEASKGR